jgi:hypothetical protein
VIVGTDLVPTIQIVKGPSHKLETQNPRTDGDGFAKYNLQVHRDTDACITSDIFQAAHHWNFPKY